MPRSPMDSYFSDCNSAIWYLAGTSGSQRRQKTYAEISDDVAMMLARAAARAPSNPRKRDVEAEVQRAMAGAAAKALAMSDAGLAERTVEFRDAGTSSDGRLMEGYAAVFDSPARIRGWEGEFDEEIAPGAFAASLSAKLPVLQYDHGRDARVGSVPIGAIEDLREDGKGLYVRARLFNNAVVEPVRQAIAGKAIRGMSFRFEVPDDGDVWTERAGRPPHRRITRADIHELGPVVFPAYDTTSVKVRAR